MTQQQVNEYDALNFEGMERKANYRVIAFREDIYHAFGRDRAKATAFHIVYRKQEYLRDIIISKNTDRAKLGKPIFTEDEVREQMWVKMSPYDFSREASGSISHSTMRNAVQALVKDKIFLVKQTGCQEEGNLAYHYQINKKAVAEKLDAIPVYPPRVTRAKSGTGTNTPTNPDTPRTKRGTGSAKSGTDPVPNAALPPYQSGYAPRANSGTHYSSISNTSENREESASFSAPESEDDQPSQSPTEEKNMSYSQGTNENDSHFVGGFMSSWIAETESTLVALEQDLFAPSRNSWLQENEETSVDAPSQVSVPTSQKSATAELFPPEPKPASNAIPDLTKGLNERGNRPLTKAEQKALDAAEQRAEALRVKGRETDLWAMAERIAIVVPRTTYAKQSITAMAQTKMSLEDIEIVMKKFDEKGNFDLTAIANYLPKYATRKKNGQPDNVTSFAEYRYQKPQPEVRIFKSKTPPDVGSHLDPNEYDEEIPFVVNK